MQLVKDRLELKGVPVSIDLDLSKDLTFVYGDSGTGKSYLCKILNEYSDEYKIQEFNYLYRERKEDLQKFICESEGFLIVINNADILLDKNLRETIVTDERNKYLIFGRKLEWLFIDVEQMGCIVFENNTIKLENYMQHERKRLGLV